MIENKYGLKYSMPHSVVHIVDNSAYTGAVPTAVADDPSLYAAIVVTGAPMGIDNKVVNITRSDILNASFGLSTLSSSGSDAKKFGQTIGYAQSLLDQGAPVRLLRVTPEGATYGLTCVVVQWRRDAANDKIHVRFKEKPFPTELRLDKFKNTDKLNSSLVNYYSNDSVSEDGYVWKQRVFINNISAGRGKIYNNMTCAINTVTQNKRPTNVAYNFITIDTRTNQTVEKFTASLINDNNGDRTDAIENVNVLVGRRVEGSSIVIPYVNESAVNAVYNEYMDLFKDVLDTTIVPDDITDIYRSMNVNTFDIIYGNYIYNGTDPITKLPYYQVDMLDTDIVKLSETNRISVQAKDFVEDKPEVLYDGIDPYTYGITRTGDNVYVGDLYLQTSGKNNQDPVITIIAAINQYSGAVTPLTIPKLYTLKNGEGSYEIDKTTFPNGTSISIVFNDTTAAAGTGSTTLNTAVVNGTLKSNSIVALMINNSFKLFTVTATNASAASGDKYTLSPAYTTEQLYQALAWTSHSSGDIGTGNLIGRSIAHTAFTRVGGTVIDAEGAVWVNGYGFDAATPESYTDRIEITGTSRKLGTPPADVSIVTDFVGTEYDVMVYPDIATSEWIIRNVKINNPGLGYDLGDIITLSDSVTPDGGGDPVVTKSNTQFRVTSVDASGSVLGIKIETPQTIEIKTPIGTSLTTGYITTMVGAGTGLTLDIATGDVTISYSGIPSSIVRYIVSGVQGSLYRVAIDPAGIPANYYTGEQGINMTSEVGGVKLKSGSTGFFDNDISDIEFKWRYSALLVRAYRGQIDPRIMSPTRVSAKFLFDGGHNTVVGQTILPHLTYTPSDIINASTIFTEDDKETVMFNPEILRNITEFEDIDVKQAMYDLMVYRCYQGIPDDKRPIGPGSGLSLHLDSGITDANTAMLINKSFAKRFDNPNASWDIGGWVDAKTGTSYTFTKQIVDNLIRHCKATSINKPYVGDASAITHDQYISYFPDIDTTDWDLRELLYNSCGNAWIADTANGSLTRQSQRTLMKGAETSDLVQESNMRTLTQLIYLLQNKINKSLLDYTNDGVLKTLEEEVTNMFSLWVGNLVDSLTIKFIKDINVDGGEILVCYVDVVFRGLILRVPIIVNVNRRSS